MRVYYKKGTTIDCPICGKTHPPSFEYRGIVRGWHERGPAHRMKNWPASRQRPSRFAR